MTHHVNTASEVSHHIFAGNKVWPNNNHLPALVYTAVFEFADDEGANEIDEHFKSNGWSNSWENSVFQYHHYHSNSHEVLGVSSGNIMLQLGGEDGTIITLQKGDVIIIPAGVAHKNVGSSEGFQCVGAYPNGEEYDINTGEEGERPATDENISNVALPKTDPVFGDKGPVLEHWRKDESKKVLETVSQF